MAMTKKEKALAKARRARNKFRGVNVTDALIGYGGLSIWTDALLRVDPIQFFMDKTGGGNSFAITGRELIDGIMGGRGGVATMHVASGKVTAANPFAVISRNAQVHGLNAVGKSIVYGIVTGVGKKATTKPRAFLNRQLKTFKMDKWIKF